MFVLGLFLLMLSWLWIYAAIKDVSPWNEITVFFH